MNLKKVLGFATVTIACIASAMFAGCTNQMAGSVEGDSRMATLSLSATGIPNDYAEQFAKSYPNAGSASRSITPNDPYEIGGIGSGSGQSDDLVLKLTGQSETGMTYGPQVVTLAETVAGSGVYDFVGTITLDSMSWTLTLTAYKGNDAVLWGRCSVDLRSGSGTAVFKMGTANLTTPGSVTIGGTIVDVDNAAVSCKAGIYRMDNEADAGSTEKVVTIETDKTFTYSATSVPPGTYLYKMIFYSGTGNIVGQFVDTLIVDPGNALNRTGLTIDVIGRKPTAPSDLKAYLVANSESSDGTTYDVKVTWTAGKYVTNYELNVVEAKADGSFDTPAADTGNLIPNGKLYGMASMDTTTPKVVKDFADSAVFGTDSSYMMYGDESCVLKLETGKLYEIQIRSRSYIGTSDWVDRIAGTDATQGTAYEAPNTQRLNRLLVKYDLNGGTLKIGGGATWTSKYAEYKSWKDNANLLDIDNTDTPPATANTLKNGTTQFASWQLSEGTAVKADGNDTTTVGDEVTQYSYKNVTVKASFGNKLSGSVTDRDKLIDVDVADITATYGLATDLTNTPNGTKPHYEVPKGTVENPNLIEVTLVRIGTKYANVKFTATDSQGKSVDVTKTADGVCRFNTNKTASGLQIILKVEADTLNADGSTNTRGASQTLTFLLD